jgi:hypothetical protein
MDESERAPQSLPHSLALIVAEVCREIRASWLHLKGKSAELYARFSGDFASLEVLHLRRHLPDIFAIPD